MAALNAARIIRRVRQRLELSQESLSRVLNATKGAVQHWERGRNRPDLARLLALRQICTPGPERRELAALIRQMQAEVAPFSVGKKGGQAAAELSAGARVGGLAVPGASVALLRRENNRLQRRVAKLETTLQRRNEQLRILQDVASDLQREIAKLRAVHAEVTEVPRGPASPATE